MRPPASQILETALALRRAPGERFRLLVQPLPQGLVHVLEVAAGSSSALQAAAADLGETEPIVVDAARFYLEQMLFAAPDADAYRILGVAQDAADADIRLHHRWLQRWLHPDRALAGDASVFATRVNQAWSQLRTPALRHDYDVGLAEARLAGAAAPLPAKTFRHWQDEEPAPRHGRRSRWLFAAALASCVVLAVLIVRHEDEDDLAAWDTPVADAASTEPVAAGGSDLDPLARALASAPAAMHEPPARRVALREPEAPRITTPPVAVIRKEQLRLPAKEPARSPTREQVRSPTPTGTRIASIASIRKPVPRFSKPLATTSAPAAATGAAAPAVVIRPPPPAPMIAAAVEAAPLPQTIAAAPAPTLHEADPAVLLDRMRKAEQRVAQVAAYLAATPGAAPLWNDVRTQADADRLRQRLAVRQGGALQFAAPNWQLQPGNATFSGTYRCPRCGIPQGRLDVQLVWREGLWLVRGVGLGPSA